MATAVANEMNVFFLAINGVEYLTKTARASESSLNQAFTEAGKVKFYHSNIFLIIVIYLCLETFSYYFY